MPWARIDDEFDDHPKVLALLEHEQGGAAVGLWTLCLSWAYRNTLKRGKTPGLIPAGLPRRYLGPSARELAALLVAAPAGFEHGLWEPLDDGGWMIHDFRQYLPTDKTREARSEAGKRGAAKRWANHNANGKEPGSDGKLPSPDGKLPSPCHDADSKAVANDGSRAPARRAISNEIAPVPVPDPEELNEPSLRSGSSSEPPVTDGRGVDEPGQRDDVERLCAHLADRVEQQTGKRPGIGKQWRRAARLLLDLDKRTEQQIHIAIDWCQDDEFWRANILSMSKLREKYITLRAAAQRGNTSPRPSTTNRAVADAQALHSRLDANGELLPRVIRGEITQ